MLHIFDILYVNQHDILSSKQKFPKYNEKVNILVVSKSCLKCMLFFHVFLTCVNWLVMFLGILQGLRLY